MAHLVFQPQHRQARRALFQDETGDRLLGVCHIGPFAEQDIEIGHVSVGDEGLGAVDHDVVTIGGEFGAHAGGV